MKHSLADNFVNSSCLKLLGYLECPSKSRQRRHEGQRTGEVVPVFFRHLHICSLRSLIRPGPRTPKVSMPLPRAGVCIWPRENVATQSYLEPKPTHASAIAL